MACFSLHKFQTSLLLLIIVIFGLATCMHGEVQGNNPQVEVAEMKPELDERYYKVDLHRATKSGEEFKMCGKCRCCPPNEKGECKDNVPCCFSKFCNLPGKSSDYCTLLPISCDCHDCNTD